MADPTTPHNGLVQALDKLADGLDRTAEGTSGLRVDLHSLDAARRRSGIVNTAILAVVGVLLIALLVVTVEIGQVVRQSRDTNARIADCTSPTGGCYRDGQSRTGQAVGALERAEVYVAECARRFPGESGPAFDAELEACVVGKLAAPPPSGPRPSGSPAPAVSRPPGR